MKRKSLATDSDDKEISTDKKPRKKKQQSEAAERESASDGGNDGTKEDDASSKEEPAPSKKKKAKTEQKTKDTSHSASSDDIKTSSEGDKYIEIGSKRRLTVRSFKGKALIDIREYYGNDGDEKPGKKGISLTPEQWQLIKSSVETIDNLIKDL
ncbi:PC4-domain-containing protein [Sistotremastrum suecicum HHB10207 ss-3]|uniref:PC4-domain-containing protein n=1 Tax=Sistotremastrum suecicum HHB10207 ss-3 TaxID=1314776 RepID=A0A166GAN1_9AGAM|nr:PC4-domain-containing protein [Sistotremastrum suecicum HHB10207 ss-3]